MSIEINWNDFRHVSQKLGRNLVEAETKLAQTFKKNGDSKQLRKDFYNLRLRYLKECLTAYATDLDAVFILAASERKDLIQIKLGFYKKRFKQDLKRLFQNNSWRNHWTLFQFTQKGNKLLGQLTEGI